MDDPRYKKENSVNLIKALQGSKTHLLVLTAIVLNGVIDQQSGQGMGLDTALQTIQIAMVSTFKAGVERVLARLAQ